MAWTNKPPTAEEVIGMTGDELKAKLDGAATKTDVTGAIDSMKTEFASTLNSLKDQLTALATPAAAAADPTDPTVSVLTDPQGFVADQTKDLRKMGMETQAQVMEMRARQDPNLANIFTQFGEDLTKKAYAFPVEQRSMPGFWPTFMRTFIGDLTIKGEIKTQYPSLIGNSSVGPNPTGATPNPAGNFSAEISGYLKDRHIPAESAAKLQRLFNDGEPITLANYKGTANA